MENKTFVIVSIVLILLDVVWFFIRKRKFGINNDFLESKHFIIKIISIYLGAICILGTVWLMGFGVIGNFAICGCCVLSIELANKQMLDNPENE